MKWLFLMILAVFLLPLAEAIGIGPAQTIIDFEPNLETGHTVIVLNNAGRDMPVTLYVDPSSDLAPYITLPEVVSVVIAEGGRATFTFTLSLPESLDRPGFHDARVGVVEGEVNSGGGLGARTAATSLLRVRVPFPGKYLDPKLSIPSVEKDQITTVNLLLTSRGLVTIEQIDADIAIYSQEELIDSFSLGSAQNIEPRGSVTIAKEWDTAGKKVGQYLGVATFRYDGVEDETKEKFNIGTKSIEIVDFTKEFEQDTINKFFVHLQSNWNYDLQDVYSTIIITKGNNVVATLKSPTISLRPWAFYKLEIFWDTVDLALGEYDATITVSFEDQEVSTKGTVTIIPKKEVLVGPVEEKPSMLAGLGGNSIVLVLAVLLGLAILINIIIIMKKRKK
ncbi:MAG: hypothetical protein ABIH34_07755 [Nanoarchaeota archaeon]